MSKKLNYRVLPFFALPFLRCANGLGIGLAIPVYYSDKLDSGLLGFVVAATAFAYLFSPFIFRNTSNKIGTKNCLWISCIGMLIVQIGLQFALESWIATYALLFLDGVCIGLFWPPIGSIFSSLLSYNGVWGDTKETKRLNRNFGLSWNSGGVSGYLLSAFALFIISDINLVFDISLIFAIICLIVVIFFEEPREKEKNSDISNDLSSANNTKINNVENYTFPFYVPLIIACVFAFFNGCFFVLFPLKFESLSYPLFIAYLFSFIKMVSQTIISPFVMTFSIRTLKKSIIPVLGTMVVSILIFGLSDNLIVQGVIFCIFGLLLAFTHSLPFKLSILKNQQGGHMKGTTYLETVFGFNFWMGPIIAGFLASVSILFGFMMFAIIITMATIAYMILQSRIKPA